MKNEHYTYNVLVVGDQKSKLDQLVKTLRKDHTVFFARTKGEAESRLKGDIALVIVDQHALETSGAGLLEKTLETHPETLWILLAESSHSKSFAQAIKRGQIYHYLKKPQKPKEMAMLVKRALEHYHLTIEHKKLLKEFQALQEQKKEILLTEKKSENFYQELRDKLDRVIQSDKLATLGQMVAGIAHEINSPSGAVNAAIVNMNHHLKSLIESFWVLDKLEITREDFRRMMGIITNMTSALDGDQRRSPGEIRDEQKRITEMLQQQGVPDSQKLAKPIARMDLTKNIDELLPLARTYDTDSILIFFTHCSRIISSAKDIKVSINMLTRIIKALKSYSYPRQEKPEIADINESIDTALTILNHRFKYRIQVEWRRGDVPNIWCYASELSHVWINIIHNAIQAIDDEGEITIETFTTDTYLGVKITDNGMGIPTEIQGRIFDIDFTTKPQGEGTGLGLYIARQIIEKHRGTIEVVSSPGKTTFEIHLPLSISSHDSEKIRR